MMTAAAPAPAPPRPWLSAAGASCDRRIGRGLALQARRSLPIWTGPVDPGAPPRRHHQPQLHRRRRRPPLPRPHRRRHPRAHHPPPLRARGRPRRACRRPRPRRPPCRARARSSSTSSKAAPSPPTTSATRRTSTASPPSSAAAITRSPPLRGPAPIFWVFHVLRDYAHTLREAGATYDARPACSPPPRRLEAAIGPIEIVFGHNDLLPANLIDDGNRLWLVDWEYAGFNSPLFDLGGLASNAGMTADERDRPARRLLRPRARPTCSARPPR